MKTIDAHAFQEINSMQEGNKPDKPATEDTKNENNESSEKLRKKFFLEAVPEITRGTKNLEDNK